MDIKDQVAFVTGAGSGMGAATARHLAELGAKVILFDLQLQAVQALAKEINGIAVQGDVSDEASVQQALSQAEAQVGVPRMGVNCAGIAPAARLLPRTGETLLADFQKVIHINLSGTFNVMRLLAKAIHTQPPLNQDGERGVIINTASVAAYEGQIGQVAYSASKGGVVAMTLPAARELAQFGIRVMTIAPGLMDTPMVAKFSDSVRQNLAETVTFPKRLGEATEFAKLVSHIIKNPYLNGSVIRLDGGLRMAAK